MTLPGFDEPAERWTRPVQHTVGWRAYKGAPVLCFDCVRARQHGQTNHVRPARHLRIDGTAETPLCTQHKAARIEAER